MGLAQPTPKVGLCVPHIYAWELQINKIPVRFFCFLNVPNIIIMITFSQGPEAEILVQNSSHAIKFLTPSPKAATITVRLNAVSLYLFIFF